MTNKRHSAKAWGYIILFFASLLISVGEVKGQDWGWVRQMGGVGLDADPKTAVDRDGNIVVVGKMSATMQLGSFTLTSAGDHDGIVAKLSSTGEVLWARSVGGPGRDAFTDVGIDVDGNVYAFGHFRDSVIIENVTLVTAGSPDLMLVKFSPSGTFLWARRAGNNVSEYPGAIAFAPNGDVFIAGDWGNETVSFGDVVLNGGIGSHVFLVRYQPDGTPIWGMTSTGGGVGLIRVGDLEIAPSGNIYLVGDYQSPNEAITFGSLSLKKTDANTMFAMKFDAVGSPVWLRAAEGGGGSLDKDYLSGLALDRDENLYLAGRVSSDDSHFGAVSVAQSRGISGILVKLSSDGSPLWGKVLAGGWTTRVADVATLRSGNVVATGLFLDSLEFDNLRFNTKGKTNVYVAELSAEGNVLWGLASNGSSLQAISLVIDSAGSICVGGNFSNSMTLGNITITSAGTSDMFVARIGALAHAPENRQASFTISPNPCTGLVSLHTGGMKFTAVDICDLFGRRVIQVPLSGSGDVHTIDLSPLSAGIYFLELQQADGIIVVERLIVH